ncbi:MAG: hypothetical protein JWS10_3978 [Cypionkella sp.]|uniref:DUF6636 domain-containing protein n=1 Tax=Cypionkella sp. TaxID=2811411 RepID=UPI00262CA72D|nr:DUF6636 domain-containing protein [Cypionkella sp.]MDB5661363.1 hypothetical protein [Cypionkella sp.]
MIRRHIPLTLALILLASPAMADDYLAFHSPSGNIQCAISTGDYAQVRCDMSALTPTYRTAPPDCEFDWGSSFAVDAGGPGYLACVSDAVADPGGLELGYGKSITLGPFTCSSEKSGMECSNLGGHGFKLSKAKQRLF